MPILPDGSLRSGWVESVRERGREGAGGDGVKLIKEFQQVRVAHPDVAVSMADFLPPRSGDPGSSRTADLEPEAATASRVQGYSGFSSPYYVPYARETFPRYKFYAPGGWGTFFQGEEVMSEISRRNDVILTPGWRSKDEIYRIAS